MRESIAHYRIGSKLGEGGMGEVYRATDTKLGRDVAVKLIAPHLAQDAERLSSFTREAQVLASLNHPNIAAIYGVEDEAIVMELVEGVTLADRIKRGPIPLDEALGIARQIADGLAAAHDRGIVHRDLKPANIKITPDGTVKLLDFGLAKAAAAAASVPDEAVTMAISMAASGMIVGTPGYMAPEQARGQQADKRADIWAFGVILYEMLTGTTLFKGETTTDIMAAVVREEPDLTRVPPVVRPVLRRCLEKDPRRRLRDVGDAILLLETASEAPYSAAPASPSNRTWLPWAAAVVALAAFLGVLWVHLRETPPVADIVRFKITMPTGVALTQIAPFAISPDGRTVAFPAVGSDGIARVWLQSFEAIDPRPLASAEIDANPGALVWSADSRSILYTHERRLKRANVDGGSPQTVVDPQGPTFGAAWHANGTILFGTLSGVMRVSAAGGPPEKVTAVAPATAPAVTPGGQALHAVLDVLPDGRHFLYTRGGAPGSRGVYVGVIDATPDEQPDTPIVMTDFGAAFVPTPGASSEGHLLLLRDATLLAQPFDAAALQTSGEPASIAENVFSISSTGSSFGIPFYSVSQQGTLVYRTGTLADRLGRQLAWMSRDGKPLGTIPEIGRYNQVKLSPDATRVVTSRTELETGNFADLWITEFAGETSTKFTFGGGANIQPVWSPDGTQIAWIRTRNRAAAIYRKSADGSGSEELLYTVGEIRGNFNASDWSPDGRYVLFAHAGDAFALPVEGSNADSRQPIPIAQTPASEFGATVSPDGRWVAYISNESGRQELYVQPFAPGAQAAGQPGPGVTRPPDPVAVGGRWMVSRGTQGLARWRRDSRELIFLGADGALMSVEVTPTPVFKASAPRTLFQLPRAFLLQAGNPGALADASRDLQRLLVAMPSEQGARQELSVVLNWPRDLD
jgi:Tol biopolymer transport system component/predicted Ser/Thr protein kinase